MRRRVVVTGIGMVTALGHSLDATWAALARGESGIGPATLFDAGGFSETRAAEVKTFNPREHFRLPKALKLTDRVTRFAVAAASMALADGTWPRDDDMRKGLGVVVGTSGSDLQPDDLARAIAPDPDARCVHEIPLFADRILSALNPLWLLINLPNMSSAHIAIQMEAHGPNSTVMTDWTAGTQAVGEACEWIRAGEADAVLAGGADSGIYPFAYGSYDQSPLLWCRTARNGQNRFVPGEGAAMLLLEERDHACQRGARQYGEIRAYHTASAPIDRSERVRPHALTQTMGDALADAAWSPDRVDEVATSAVFAEPFSTIEQEAILTTLGSAATTVRRTEFTSRLGHALGACGAIDLALVLRSAAAAPVARATLCSALGYSGQATTLAVLAGGRSLDG